MDYLTRYYKNLAENLEEKKNFLLNEIDNYSIDRRIRNRGEGLNVGTNPYTQFDPDYLDAMEKQARDKNYYIGTDVGTGIYQQSLYDPSVVDRSGNFMYTKL